MSGSESSLYLEKGQILRVTPLLAVLYGCRFIGVKESQATQNAFSCQNCIYSAEC